MSAADVKQKSRMNTTPVILHDQNRWKLEHESRRIPKDAQEPLAHFEAMVHQANSLWERACSEAEVLKKKAVQDGREEGKQQVREELVNLLLEAQQAARSHLDHSDSVIIELAGAIVEKILPSIPTDLVMKDILGSALRSMQADRYLRVLVHPDSIAIVEQKIQEWRNSRGLCESLEVVSEPGLDPFACIVESELGVVQAGASEQLSEILKAAKGALVRREVD
ncbi:MAG: hypothetical protein MI864_01790 [Pseudomonadales bacterium]|uniref:Flagellar assembly protein FliH n=1 Tax=Oleiphilus messinensis TaxID=141451 RepID=A0A1Y0IG31_9GAMM|nr:FliH/SctL family protein [Oleiphilus messinensis]ARU59431.1 type III secretory pathway apparatus component [Oleiphilus messinensis]MCG8609243.1 hypothetical protein [Pseudomonadales bacterium]